MRATRLGCREEEPPLELARREEVEEGRRAPRPLPARSGPASEMVRGRRRERHLHLPAPRLLQRGLPHATTALHPTHRRRTIA